MSLTVGARLGPYQVVAPIGAGGMGEVYRARDTRLARDVALKVLPPAAAGDPDRLRRFEQEARAAAALNHPNILAVFDVGADGGVNYVVSELLEGETLRERLKTGAVPPRKTVEYAAQMARGLAAAHEKDIVHRDVKPENLFLTRDGRLKILDFGIAKLLGPAVAEQTIAPTIEPGTTPGMVLGTVGYMSPEQVRGLPADHRTDIFSFGAVADVPPRDDQSGSLQPGWRNRRVLVGLGRKAAGAVRDPHRRHRRTTARHPGRAARDFEVGGNGAAAQRAPLRNRLLDLDGHVARAPLGGGAPREILRDIGSADWSPDGKQLAMGTRHRQARPGDRPPRAPAHVRTVRPGRSARRRDAICVRGWGHVRVPLQPAALRFVRGRRSPLTYVTHPAYAAYLT